MRGNEEWEVEAELEDGQTGVEIEGAYMGMIEPGETHISVRTATAMEEALA